MTKIESLLLNMTEQASVFYTRGNNSNTSEFKFILGEESVITMTNKVNDIIEFSFHTPTNKEPIAKLSKGYQLCYPLQEVKSFIIKCMDILNYKNIEELKEKTFNYQEYVILIEQVLKGLPLQNKNIEIEQSYDNRKMIAIEDNGVFHTMSFNPPKESSLIDYVEVNTNFLMSIDNKLQVVSFPYFILNAILSEYKVLNSLIKEEKVINTPNDLESMLDKLTNETTDKSFAKLLSYQKLNEQLPVNSKGSKLKV